MRNDYSDYLMHRDHKYTSREWINGKWNYIYGEKFGANKRKRAKEAMYKSNLATIKYAQALSRSNQLHAKENPSQLEIRSNERDKSAKQKAMIDSRKEYDAAMKEYSKTPLYKLEKKVITGKLRVQMLLMGKTKSNSKTKSKSRPLAREKNVTNNGTGIQKKTTIDPKFRIRQR